MSGRQATYLSYQTDGRRAKVINRGRFTPNVPYTSNRWSIDDIPISLLLKLIEISKYLDALTHNWGRRIVQPGPS